MKKNFMALVIITSIILIINLLGFVFSVFNKKNIAFTSNNDDTIIIGEVLETKIANMLRQTGASIIKGSNSVGIIKGKSGNRIEIYTIRVVNSENGKNIYGLAVSMVEYYNKENVSYIDYDEIDALINGLDFIWNFEKNMVPMQGVEIAYKTKGNFGISYSHFIDQETDTVEKREISFFSNKSNDDSLQTIQLDIVQIKDFKDLLVTAKKEIEIIRS